MKKTNLFFLKEPKVWRVEHLQDMVKMYREFDLNIKVFKEVEGDSYFLKFKNFDIKFKTIGEICKFLFSYYRELCDTKKSNLIKDYLKNSLLKEINYASSK